MAPGRIVAVIDVGSNSVRLLVARQLSPGAFEVIDEERYDARLGAGQDAAGLTKEAIARGIRAMRLMSQVARSHAPSAIVAVGTEALRRAPNSFLLLDEVERETGLRVRILSTDEEAYASFLGVVNSTLIRDGAIVDIGGGSLEYMTVRQRRLTASTSAPLGAIYARERYLKGDPPTAKEVRALRRAVNQAFAVEPSPGMLVGVGGAIRNLARIVRLRRGYPLRRIHGLTLSRREVRALARSLVQVDSEARRRMPGVSPARADIIHSAAIVVDEMMEMAKASQLVVSGQGLREGLLWQELRGESAILPDVRAASISGLARANGVDELAAEPVVSVAATLFDATAREHAYGRAELDLLVAAARLASIGMHIDYYDRERHGQYLVYSGDLHGFSHREIVLLGAIVRCADAGSPDLSLYRSLVEPDDVRRVSMLATLLGLARATRRRMPSPVHDVRVIAEDGALCLHLSGSSPLDAELVAVCRHERRVESVLGLKLRVSAS